MKMTKEKTKSRKWMAVGGVLLGLAVILFTTILYLPKPLWIDFLFYEDEPVKADVIILLSGDGRRMEKAAELYHAGYAEKMILTTAKEAGTTVERAESFGIPREDLIPEYNAESTYENAAFVKDIVLDHQFQSALVVTSNYHMRRTKLAYDRVFRDTDVQFTYVPYQHKELTRNSWEEHEELFKKEYKKLIGGYFLYFDGWMDPLRKKFEEILEER